MTKSSRPGQRQTVSKSSKPWDFGSIERLSIRGGLAAYEPELRVIQTIKLDGETGRQMDCSCADLTLKKEFEALLFDHCIACRTASSIFEVRHSPSVRLVL